MATRRGAIDWSIYRAQFPVTNRAIYFNHAAVSPLSAPVVRAMNEVTESFLREGILCEERVFAKVEEARTATARLVGARTEEIAFTKNTTQGVLAAAHGIRWKRGDNIVMPAVEFPANVYPWLALAKRGVRVRMVAPREGRVTVDMVAEACTARTRAVTISSVQFSNGFRADVDAMGDFCRDRRIYLHVDGIQSLGMLRCDVRRMKIDLLSAGGHKWLLGPTGSGFFYCRRELMSELDVWNPGWLGVVNARAYLDYDPTPRDDARRWEEGSLNLYGICGLGAAVERFLEIGMPNVERRILGLTDLLEKGLRGRGYRITSPRGARERSGIICFDRPGTDTDEIYRRLSDGGVVASLRHGAVRFAPHFYNTEDEVERALGLL
jgi:cysteine desulfurase/selenocysteine lyase